MPHICVLSSAPFQILLAFFFLYQMVKSFWQIANAKEIVTSSSLQVGVSALAGLAVLSVLVPANLVGEAVRYHQACSPADQFY